VYVPKMWPLVSLYSEGLGFLACKSYPRRQLSLIEKLISAFWHILYVFEISLFEIIVFLPFGSDLKDNPFL